MRAKIKTLAPVTVTTAGTRVPLSTDAIQTASFVVQADSLNAGHVFVGDSSVDSSNGIELAAGESVSSDVIAGNFLAGEFLLSEVYVDSASNGNVVRVTYIGRR